VMDVVHPTHRIVPGSLNSVKAPALTPSVKLNYNPDRRVRSGRLSADDTGLTIARRSNGTSI